MFHQAHVERFKDNYTDHIYSIFRIIFGFIFFTHGLQKFGIGSKFNFMMLPPLLKAAGIIELVCGALIMLGLFTQWAAFLASGEMAVTFFTQHIPMAMQHGVTGLSVILPLMNGGEAPVLYCFAFLLIFFLGPGQWSLDELWCTKCAREHKRHSKE